jgi:hypothetical protein
MDIADLAQPREVWKAVEGDCADLVALLRSDKPLSKTTRGALADWYEGKLRPMPIPKGRPEKLSQLARTAIENTYLGHDPTTELGWAGFRYATLRVFIRKKGWHRKRAGRFHWSTERLLNAIAIMQGLDAEKLGEYLKRARPKSAPQSWYGEEFDNRCRLRIALDIRRTKTRT